MQHLWLLCALGAASTGVLWWRVRGFYRRRRRGGLTTTSCRRAELH